MQGELMMRHIIWHTHHATRFRICCGQQSEMSSTRVEASGILQVSRQRVGWKSCWLMSKPAQQCRTALLPYPLIDILTALC